MCHLHSKTLAMKKAKSKAPPVTQRDRWGTLETLSAIKPAPLALRAWRISAFWMALLLSASLSAQQAGPEVVYAVAPEWLALNGTRAKEAHKEVVLVKVAVDGFGNVVETKLLTPRSFYSVSAVHAASLWKFGEPIGSGPDAAKLNGMTATLKFTFELLPISTSIDETGTSFIPPYEVRLGRLVKQKR
jgi:hypothetical protein